jgi:hypothetical protein
MTRYFPVKGGQCGARVSSNCNQTLREHSGSPLPGYSPSMHGDVVNTMILESCHSTWIFDMDRNEFCRILKGVEAAGRLVTTEWRQYSDLVLDPLTETFTVHLNTTHTRQIRSWRHTRDCVRGHEKSPVMAS